MNQILINYLFNHHYFVNLNGEIDPNGPEIRLSLARLFSIRITSGEELLQYRMIQYASQMLGTNVPVPFYTGFPQSVLKLSSDQLLLDQLLHYYRTYGRGDFSEAGHSVFEENIERKAFNEQIEIRDFSVISNEEAIKILQQSVSALLSGTRPLSKEQYTVVLTFINEYHYEPEKCASKNLAMRLLADTRDTYFAGFLMLSDVPKLADELNYQAMVRKAIWEKENRALPVSKQIKNLPHPAGGGPQPTQLNLGNRDRKLISAVIDKLISSKKIDTRNCYEKKALWSGLLHHIHYKTKDPNGLEFVNAMRGRDNLSAFSEFEKVLAEKGPVAAAECIIKSKGEGTLLRTLDHLLSRCKSDKEVDEIIQKISRGSSLILFQMFFHYSQPAGGNRTFRFVKHEMMKVHTETDDEAKRRKSILAERERNKAVLCIYNILQQKLKNRLGRVYIDPEMKLMALPLREGAAQGGFGTLTTGSRIQLPAGKKIRAFTYWEKVNDIDLSLFGLDKDGKQYEFSWRTMALEQNEGIVFSGDETSGYSGGSEYFDIDPDMIRQIYPDMRYLVFCNNIFSNDQCKSFNLCICRAGYMLRNVNDSGEIFEPKTVKSSFRISCNSFFALLFGFDLMRDQFVWLNTALDSSENVAGNTNIAALMQGFSATDIYNVYDFFQMMASELTDDPKTADIAVTDKEIETGENTEVIRSYDTEKMIALLNQ